MYFPAAEATTHDTSVLASVFLVLSHLPILPSIWIFTRLRVWVALSIVISVAIFSDVYHICRADWYCFGLGNTTMTSVVDNVTVLSFPGLENARMLDHISSTNAWAQTLLVILMGDGGGGHESTVARILLLFSVIYAVQAFPYEMQSIFVVLVTVIAIYLVFVLYTRKFSLPLADRFNIKWIAAGIVVGSAGFGMYFINAIPYAYAHPIWHMCIIVALIFIELGVSQTRMQHVHLCPQRSCRIAYNDP